MDKYPCWSPYNYVMNNPLVLVDPDGMEVRLNNQRDAERLAKEINKVLSGEHVSVVTFSVENYGKTQTYYMIDANENSLDWGADKYLSAAFDVFASKEHVFNVIFPHEADAYGGGHYRESTKQPIIDYEKTKSQHEVILSYIDSKYDNGTMGVIFFHEAIGHGHPVTGPRQEGNATLINEYFGFNKFESHDGYFTGTGWTDLQKNLWRKKNK